MNAPSICLIVPFFDEKKKLAWLRPKGFPFYFDYFIDSYARSTQIDLKIFTNVPCATYAKKYKESSIDFHQISLKKMFNLLKKKLSITGYDYEQYRAYKICDLKPMLGHVLDDYLKGYDYWGYIDPDVIIGNLENFLTADNVGGYDVISGGRNNLTGYLSIYRNAAPINLLYQKSPDYLKVINSPKNHRFDENGGGRGIVAMEQVTRDNPIKVNYINCVHNDFGKVNDIVDNSSRDWVYRWQEGTLTDQQTQTEIGMFHLMKSKGKSDFRFEKFRRSDGFSISRKGLHYL